MGKRFIPDFAQDSNGQMKKVQAKRFDKNKNGVYNSQWQLHCQRLYNRNMNKKAWDNRSDEYKQKQIQRLTQWNKNNKEKHRQRNKIHYRQNRQTITKRHIQRAKNRRKEDALYKFRQFTRANICNSFSRTGYKKSKKTQSILGCSLNQFKDYISTKFIEGMTFQNYGNNEYNEDGSIKIRRWHLDHIIALSSGNSEKEIVNLCHYTNYQPLWDEDNRRKYNK